MSKYEPGGFPPPLPHVVKLQERISELEAALRKYGEHSTQCNRLGVINGDCYCGFAHVLDSLEESSQSDASGGTE
jgi:hypothetical protein